MATRIIDRTPLLSEKMPIKGAPQQTGKEGGHLTWQVVFDVGEAYRKIESITVGIFGKLVSVNAGIGNPDFVIMSKHTASPEQIAEGGYMFFIKDQYCDYVRADVLECKLAPEPPKDPKDKKKTDEKRIPSISTYYGAYK